MGFPQGGYPHRLRASLCKCAEALLALLDVLELMPQPAAVLPRQQADENSWGGDAREEEPVHEYLGERGRCGAQRGDQYHEHHAGQDRDQGARHERQVAPPEQQSAHSVEDNEERPHEKGDAQEIEHLRLLRAVLGGSRGAHRCTWHGPTYLPLAGFPSDSRAPCPLTTTQEQADVHSSARLYPRALIFIHAAHVTASGAPPCAPALAPHPPGYAGTGTPCA